MYMNATAVFDGQSLRPDAPLDLKADTRYWITIRPLPPTPTQDDAWAMLETLTGTVEAPRDWASEHDHYLYGVPKRQSKASV